MCVQTDRNTQWLQLKPCFHFTNAATLPHFYKTPFLEAWRDPPGKKTLGTKVQLFCPIVNITFELTKY